MHVLILSQYYAPEPIPKPVELAQALKEQGDTVWVVTGFPNYPSGKIYPGYQAALFRREVIDGVDVYRTYEYPYHGTRAVGRFANYASFMVSATFAAFVDRRVDVIYVWHPPLTVGISAWILSRLRGIPIVYDVQDIWPEAAVLSGMLKPGIIVSALARLERFVYGQTQEIITVTEGARRNVVSKGVRPDNVHALPHWFTPGLFVVDSAEQRRKVRREYGWANKFVAVFAGNLGLVQGLETVVRAVGLLGDAPSIHVVFIGDGAAKPMLREMAVHLKVENRLEFIDRQPMEAMPGFFAAADALLVHLRWSELSNFVVPSKTLAYLASARPIIMAMAGASADLVRDAGAGYVVEPENPDALAAGLLQLSRMSAFELGEMGRRGREYLLQYLSKEVVIPRYRNLLSHAISRRSGLVI